MKKNSIKKITGISLCAALVFSSSFSVIAVNKDSTDSASYQTAETSQPDNNPDYSMYKATRLPKPLSLDEETENQIKEDYLKKVNVNGENYTKEQVTVNFYGGLGDDQSWLVFTEVEGIEYPEMMCYDQLGRYIYVYSSGRDVKLYKNHDFYSIKALYDDGEFEDFQLNNIAFLLHLQILPDGDKTKTDIENLIHTAETAGNNYTPESFEAYMKAYLYAKSVIEDENATQEKINKAYYELDNAIYNLVLCDWDRDKLILCYSYGEEILNNYTEYFSEESIKNLKTCMQGTPFALYYAKSQEEVDKAANDLEAVLTNLEQTVENPDIVSYNETKKTNEILKDYFGKLYDYYGKLYDNESEAPYCINSLPLFKDFNGYRLVSAHYNGYFTQINSIRMGDYIVESNNLYAPSELACMAVNSQTGEVITLEKAIENGIVDLDKLFECYDKTYFNFKMYLIGDADYDGRLTVKDATLIQKTAIGILEEDKKDLKKDSAYDFNKDSRVSILDTTEVQRKLIL